jgi:hypothetical protein
MEPRFGHDFSRVRVHSDAHTITPIMDPYDSGAGPAGGVRPPGAAEKAQGNEISLDAARTRRPLPTNTVECVKKWTPCSAPYSPGSWAAKVTYHCPVWPGLPGTTEPAYVTIPDEFIGTDSDGDDMYRCRPGFQVRFKLDIADIAATTLNRNLLYPDFPSCHAGFRTILNGLLSSLFAPSGGGRPWGGRVGRSIPEGDFPCP